MTGVDMSLLAGLIVALAVTVGNLRAWGWLVTIAASYTASTLYWRNGGSDAAFVAGMCDAVICLSIYFLAKERWEIIIGRLFLVSVGVNMIYYPSTIGLMTSLSHNAYASILEAINWIALFYIGGMGMAQIVGSADDVPVPRFVRRLYRLVLPLFQPRKRLPFTQAGQHR